jgi:hypothetical protein
VLVLHTTYVLRVPYSCGVVLVFLVLAGNSFWCCVCAHLLRVSWRNFVPVVLLCQIFVLAGNRCWFYILLMYLEYHTVVVLC